MFLTKLLLSSFLLVMSLCPALAQEGTVRQHVYLRSDPSTTNPPIGTLRKGTTVTLLEAAPKEGFYHVKTMRGKEGWVGARYLAAGVQGGTAELAAPLSGASGCDATLWDHVYNPQRLIVKQKCIQVTGTIVDATIVHAPSSTKNREQKRDPEMHQTRKGKQWYFGMKAHVGVDSKSKLIHAVVATPANVADAGVLPDLLHGDETRVWGDQAYRGQGRVLEEYAPRAQDFTCQRYRYKNRIDELERAKNRTKAKVRSKVEHVFAVMKLKFGFVKVRYRGIAKNANRLFATCALVNLFLVRKKLLGMTAA